jgi:hypothetical protein
MSSDWPMWWHLFDFSLYVIFIDERAKINLPCILEIVDTCKNPHMGFVGPTLILTKTSLFLYISIDVHVCTCNRKEGLKVKDVEGWNTITIHDLFFLGFLFKYWKMISIKKITLSIWTSWFGFASIIR